MKLSLSQNICKLRKANHLTQEQLAEALGVTFAAISKWEPRCSYTGINPDCTNGGFVWGIHGCACGL